MSEAQTTVLCPLCEQWMRLEGTRWVCDRPYCGGSQPVSETTQEASDRNKRAFKLANVLMACGVRIDRAYDEAWQKVDRIWKPGSNE